MPDNTQLVSSSRALGRAIGNQYKTRQYTDAAKGIMNAADIGYDIASAFDEQAMEKAADWVDLQFNGVEGGEGASSPGLLREVYSRNTDVDSLISEYNTAFDNVFNASAIAAGAGISERQASKFVGEYRNRYKTRIDEIASSSKELKMTDSLRSNFDNRENYFITKQSGKDFIAIMNEDVIPDYDKNAAILGDERNPRRPENWVANAGTYSTQWYKADIENNILSGMSETDFVDRALENYRKCFPEGFDADDSTKGLISVKEEEIRNGASEYYIEQYGKQNRLSSAKAGNLQIAAWQKISENGSLTNEDFEQMAKDAGMDIEGNSFDASAYYSVLNSFGLLGRSEKAFGDLADAESKTGQDAMLSEADKIIGETGTLTPEQAQELAIKHNKTGDEPEIQKLLDKVTAAETADEQRRISEALASINYEDDVDYDGDDYSVRMWNIDSVSDTIDADLTGLEAETQSVINRYNNLKSADASNLNTFSGSSLYGGYYERKMKEFGITSKEGKATFLKNAIEREKVLKPAGPEPSQAVVDFYSEYFDNTAVTDDEVSAELFYQSGQGILTPEEAYRIGEELGNRKDIASTPISKAREELDAYLDTFDSEDDFDDKVFTKKELEYEISKSMSADGALRKIVMSTRPENIPEVVRAYVDETMTTFMTDRTNQAIGNVYDEIIKDLYDDGFHLPADSFGWFNLGNSLNDKNAIDLFKDYISNDGTSMGWVSEDAVTIVRNTLHNGTSATVKTGDLEDMAAESIYGKKFSELESEGQKNRIRANVAVASYQELQAETILDFIGDYEERVPNHGRKEAVWVEDVGVGYLCSDGLLITLEPSDLERGKNRFRLYRVPRDSEGYTNAFSPDGDESYMISTDGLRSAVVDLDTSNDFRSLSRKADARPGKHDEMLSSYRIYDDSLWKSAMKELYQP